MTTTYSALCSDFYVNMKMSVRMELPRSREPVLELFERLRRTFPSMASFRRYKDELALESGRDDLPHRWVAIRDNSVRSGVVNPPGDEQMHDLHRIAAEACPYYLSISPLDLEYIELLYGFDLAARGNHDEIVAGALLEGSPLAGILQTDGVRVQECQPLLTMTLDEGRVQASVEVKTRSGSGPAHAGGGRGAGEPISLYLSVRRYDPVTDLRELPTRIDELGERGRELVDSIAIPNLLVPLRDGIAGGEL